MPTFSFKNKDTGEEFEDFMSNSAKEEFLAANPHIIQTITYAPAIADPIQIGVTKTPDSFNSLLKNISKRNNNRKNKSEIHYR